VIDLSTTFCRDAIIVLGNMTDKQAVAVSIFLGTHQAGQEFQAF